jgi:steroid delta-isomerase-like uncharacterized protein
MSDAAVNEAVAHRWHMELFQEGKLEVAEEILLPDFVFHTPLEDGKGVEAARQLATDFRAVFPDLTITHEDTVAAGDKVAIRWTARGTHHGELLGVPATGKEIGSGGIDIFHLRDGKVAEVWIEWNVLSHLQQMGAAVVPGPEHSAEG